MVEKWNMASSIGLHLTPANLLFLTRYIKQEHLC